MTEASTDSQLVGLLWLKFNRQNNSANYFQTVSRNSAFLSLNWENCRIHFFPHCYQFNKFMLLK